jgi:hypothetical protein
MTVEVTQVARTDIPFEIIDPEIRRLVALLNRFPGISTTNSCAGHGPGEPCYVSFRADSQEDVRRLVRVLPVWGCRAGFRENRAWSQHVGVFVAQDPDQYVLQIEGCPLFIQRELLGEVERALAVNLTRPDL